MSKMYYNENCNLELLKNLTVAGNIDVTMSGGENRVGYVGGIAAYNAAGGRIENCRNLVEIGSHMTITDEAKTNSSVSNPYVLNKQVLVMKADKIANYKDKASLKDLTIAVENGSAGQDAAAAAGVTDLILVADQAAALMEVKAGTSQACVIDITMANAMTGEGTNYADLAAGISLTSEEYGVSFRKESDLTAKFNAFMDKLIADGTLQALAEKYSLTLAK